jgi:putative Mn2+ efflux pump MntP
MGLVDIIFIALGLAMDAFAVSVAAAATDNVRSKRAVFRLSFHFGLFQFLMPIVGWAAGIQIVSVVSRVAPWVAFGLLAFVGGRMIWSCARAEEASFTTDPSKGLMLVSLSVATSIDALAVGVSLAMLDVEIWTPSVVIGVITGLLALIGIWMGSRLGQKLGNRVGIAGGVVLCLIGAHILLDHLI